MLTGREMNIMQNEKKVFYCYNSNVRRWLSDNGTTWINKGIHHKTDKPFWVYEQSTRLSNLLKEYKNKQID